VNYDNSLVVTITVTCYSWPPLSGDHLFTCGAIFWPPHTRFILSFSQKLTRVELLLVMHISEKYFIRNSNSSRSKPMDCAVRSISNCFFLRSGFERITAIKVFSPRCLTMTRVAHTLHI